MATETSFIIDLKEMVSAGLAKMAAASRSAFGGIGKDIGVTKQALAGLATTTTINVDSSGIKEALEELKELKRQLAEVHESSGRAAGGMRGMWDMARGSFVGNLAARGVEEGIRAVKEVGMSALEKGMETERQMVGLSVFVGDKKAKEVYEGLQKQAVMTPFQTSDMLPIEMGLVATGMTPERANRDMMALMNAVAATGGNEFMLSLTGTHLAQAAAAGQIDGRILNEFQKTAHIPIQRLIADDLFPKLSHEAGVKKVKDMDTITYDQFTHALQRASEAGGLFAGGMEKLSQTMSGKWSTIKDFWSIGLSKLTMSQHDKIIKLEDEMIAGLEKFPEIIAGMAGSVGRIFDFANGIRPGVNDFIGGLKADLKPIIDLGLSSGVKDLINGFGSLTGTILHDLKPAIEIVAGLTKAAASSAGFVLQGISADLGFGKAVDGVDNFYSQMPKWQRDLSNQGGMSEIGKLHDYMMKNYGGKVAPWMESREQLEYWKSHHEFDHSGAIVINKPGVRPIKQEDWLKKQGGTGAKGAMPDGTANRITGGGGRNITINFRNFTEHFTVQNNGADMDGNGHKTEQWFMSMFRRILQMTPG